jgi:hypothetical protein
VLEHRGPRGHLGAADELAPRSARDLVLPRGAEAVGVLRIAGLGTADAAPDAQPGEAVEQEAGQVLVDGALARGARQFLRVLPREGDRVGELVVVEHRVPARGAPHQRDPVGGEPSSVHEAGRALEPAQRERRGLESVQPHHGRAVAPTAELGQGLVDGHVAPAVHAGMDDEPEVHRYSRPLRASTYCPAACAATAPSPAATTSCRNGVERTSPTANRPGIEVSMRWSVTT